MNLPNRSTNNGGRKEFSSSYMSTYSRVPLMTSSKGRGVPERERLALIGCKVRGGGLRLLADCAQQDREDALSSRGRFGRALVDKIELDPGLISILSSQSLKPREGEKAKECNELSINFYSIWVNCLDIGRKQYIVTNKSSYCSIKQGFPTPGPWPTTGLWPIQNWAV